jgi:Bacterial Ig-like domain
MRAQVRLVPPLLSATMAAFAFSAAAPAGTSTWSVTRRLRPRRREMATRSSSDSGSARTARASSPGSVSTRAMGTRERTSGVSGRRRASSSPPSPSRTRRHGAGRRRASARPSRSPQIRATSSRTSRRTENFALDRPAFAAGGVDNPPLHALAKAMDPATIGTSTIVLSTSDGPAVPAAVAYDSNTRQATLRPISALSLSTTFAATVKGGAGGVTSASGAPSRPTTPDRSPRRRR